MTHIFLNESTMTARAFSRTPDGRPLKNALLVPETACNNCVRSKSGRTGTSPLTASLTKIAPARERPRAIPPSCAKKDGQQDFTRTLRSRNRKLSRTYQGS